MKKVLYVDCFGALALVVLMLCGSMVAGVSAQNEKPDGTVQPKIKLVDPNKELTQLELFKVDELFEIAKGKGAYTKFLGGDSKEDFLYRVWGRTPKNALFHLGAQFPYASLIPRYKELYTKKRISDAWYPLTTIDSREALEVVLNEYYRGEAKDGDIAWLAMYAALDTASYWDEKKYQPLEPYYYNPKTWWDKVKDKWPGHLLYRTLEDALSVMRDKSSPQKERERAGEFVVTATTYYLPLASLLPYVEPIARDTSESFELRKLALRTIGNLKANDSVPVLIDLLTDLSKGDRCYYSYKVPMTIADLAYSWLRRKTGVSACYNLALEDHTGELKDLCYLDARDLPLTLREIIALDLCPAGYTTPDGVLLGYRVMRLSELSESERLKLQLNWRYFWEKMKDWILVQ